MKRRELYTRFLAGEKVRNTYQSQKYHIKNNKLYYSENLSHYTIKDISLQILTDKKGTWKLYEKPELDSDGCELTRGDLVMYGDGENYTGIDFYHSKVYGAYYTNKGTCGWENCKKVTLDEAREYFMKSGE